MALRRIIQNPYEVYTRRQRVGSVTGQGPKCMTCLQYIYGGMHSVGGVELVEGLPGQTVYARVLVRHHGAEELQQFDFGSIEWDSDDLKKKIDRTEWFDPYAITENGGGLGT